MARLIDADELRECFEPADFDNDDGFENCWNAVRITDAAPTVDAIPMWWITEKFLDVLNKDKELSKAVWLVRKAWQKEQEAQDGKA